MYAIYGNIYHRYTPVMLAYIPAPWILWVLDHVNSLIRFLPAFVGQIRTFCWLNCWIYMFAGPSSHLCWLCPHCRWQTQGFQSLNMPMITVISPRNLGDMWWISGRTHLCSFLRPLRALHSAMDAMDRAGDWYIKLVIHVFCSPSQNHSV